jgi:hypothetical protein
MQAGDVSHALRDLVRGDGVRRASHDLHVEGEDVSRTFLAVLESEGYCEMKVEEVPIEPGERAPAVCLADGAAHFGWVFWEVFSPDRKRKIFGSNRKNRKGDWAVLLMRNSPVYVCPALREPMDIERPSGL